VARALRISFLLFVLVVVAAGAWLDRHITTSWQHTVWVGLYPVNADGGDATQRYIGALRDDDLASIATFINAEAHRHGIAIDEPVHVQLHALLAERPPELSPQAGVPGRALWSLKLRAYRWRALHASPGPRPQIALFLMYHDPARAAVMPDSLGLQAGLMGIAHLFALPSQDGQNAVVIAHELLHVFGASDKYSALDDAPAFPDGYAEPSLVPLLPQRYAELMAGRIPLAAGRAEMPDSLLQVRIGERSAREIGWVRGP
jgi:hypothetical protein